MADKIGNPFLEENFVQGGAGLWDGKVVTVLSAKTEIEPLTHADGSPVINDRSGEPAIRHVLAIVGIADDEEKERKQTFSAGSLLPSPDGEGFIDPKTGGPGLFHNNSEITKFVKGLKAGGFDMNILWDDAAQQSKVSKLVGARLLFKAEPQLDKDGKVKKNKKGYDQNRFYPVQFMGFKEGVGPTTVNTNAAAIKTKADETILAILTEAGGKISRAELVRKVSGKLAGQPDVNKVLAMVTRDDYHKDQPWTRDATGFSL